MWWARLLWLMWALFGYDSHDPLRCKNGDILLKPTLKRSDDTSGTKPRLRVQVSNAVLSHSRSAVRISMLLRFLLTASLQLFHWSVMNGPNHASQAVVSQHGIPTGLLVSFITQIRRSWSSIAISLWEHGLPSMMPLANKINATKNNFTDCHLHERYKSHKHKFLLYFVDSFEDTKLICLPQIVLQVVEGFLRNAYSNYHTLYFKLIRL